MSNSRVTDEAVEAAAQRLFVDAEGEFIQPANPWLTTFEFDRRAKYTRRARAALEAAVPLLAPQPAVDRDALLDCVFQAADSWDEPIGSAEAAEIADAVLALLNGSAK